MNRFELLQTIQIDYLVCTHVYLGGNIVLEWRNGFHVLNNNPGQITVIADYTIVLYIPYLTTNRHV